MTNNTKINNGKRVSHRNYGKGTVVASNAGNGWIIKFDNDSWNGPVYDWEIWSEDGFTHSENF